ncbi:hypothetical protein BDQ17DRAFT_1428306 [Cyathus striatus]|nr:hypothetical protein BDQ17DRAFT_1428306 [Cyathus striatus]
MPPCRSAGNKSTSVNATTISGNTDNSPEPSNACKHAVSSTEAATQPAKKKGKKDKQNIVDDGTSVAPPKQIRNAAVSLLPASETQIATSGVSVALSAGENASNNSSDSSGSEFEEVSSKHKKNNEDTGNKTSKDTHNKGSEDTGNQTSKTSKGNHNESNENTGNQTSKNTHKDMSNIESLSEHENADDHITDVHMASPPKTQTYNLQGSSHVTGGFMHYHAQGNVYNSADFLEIEKQLTYLEHIPVSVNSMEPVMKGLAKKYDPIADSNQ